MTKDRTTGTRADASKRELTEEQLNTVSGGVVSPRDPASGLPTGKRMHKPYGLAESTI
jgi:bacteriocin-like protein